MKQFTNLYYKIDGTTRTSEKVEALAEYFLSADASDSAWAVLFLTGRRLARVVKAANLRAWAAEASGTPEWLFMECYDAVGDMAETMALLLPPADEQERIDRPLHEWIEHVLLRIRDLPELQQKSLLSDAWKALDERERFVWNKLITGAFRVGASKQLVVKAIAKTAGIDESTISHRLMGDWAPTKEFFLDLVAKDSSDADVSKPYPFYLAYAIEGSPQEELGDCSKWRAEWKWDGIRTQLIRRGGATFVWSRGEELVTDRFPEIKKLGDALPSGTVIDGEILVWKEDSPLPFAQLQRRIGRKTLGKKILADAPVILMAFDLIEFDGVDIRQTPLEERLDRLSSLTKDLPWLAGEHLRIAPAWSFLDWQMATEQRSRARVEGAEGLMLKRLGSVYGVGRRRGDWWKWKVNPLTADAVLIAAQRGSGKRASLYTDYTFGVWDKGELVPIAKAYSGLSDAEILQVDAFVRKNMVEKFGPVRTVRPQLVFELAFEGINLSTRHKSGVAVRFPRILRQRFDKTPEQADSLDNLKILLESSMSLLKKDLGESGEVDATS